MHKARVRIMGSSVLRFDLAQRPGKFKTMHRSGPNAASIRGEIHPIECAATPGFRRMTHETYEYTLTTAKGFLLMVICGLITVWAAYMAMTHNGSLDLGAVTYGLVLAAWSKGLGCVINGQGIMQSPVVREHAQIPEDQVIMTCVAMGWPDETFPANAVVSTRKSVDEAAVFRGF